MKRLPFDYAVRNLSRSPTRLLLSVLGCALVVLLTLAAGGFLRGMDKSLRPPANNRNVILLGAGSEESVERSEISPLAPGLVTAAVSGIRSRLGTAYVSPEVHMQATVKSDRAAEAQPQILLRGMTAPAFLVHSQARVAEGRAPAAGKDEMLAGRLAAAKLGLPRERVAVGESLFFDGRDWSIVGILEAPGSVIESEIWLPLTDLQIAARRDNLSRVVLTLGDAEFDDVDTFARQRLDLELIAMRESDYYARLAGFFSPIRAMVWATAVLIASGAILGGLNTMYAAFASRVREVGALQAIGFPRRAIVLSLVQESLLASAGGTLIGCVVGLVVLDGLSVQFSMGVFGLLIDSGVLLTGMLAGLVVGIVGALPPAVRCLRLPINEALKAA